MQALIDHDLVVFRCAASAENDSLNIAIHRAESLLDELLTKTGADSYRAFLSGKSNFRKAIYPEYKLIGLHLNQYIWRLYEHML